MTDAEGLQAFIVAAARLDPALARWAAAAVWSGLSPSRRRRMRNDLLRQAARLLPPLSAWQKAHVLADLARRPCSPPGVGSAAQLVALALGVYPSCRRDRKLGAAQLSRVLVSHKSPSEMEVDAAPTFTLTLDHLKRARHDDRIQESRHGWTPDNDPMADGERRPATRRGPTCRDAIETERAMAPSWPSISGSTTAPRASALYEARDWMSEALGHRMGGPAPEADEAKRFVGMSFADQVALCSACAACRGRGRTAMVERGIVTGDVGALLEGAGNRVLRKSFESYTAGLQTVCGRAPSRDFRDVKLIQIDGDIALQEVKDGAPFAYGSLQASAETYPITTFGRIFGLRPHPPSRRRSRRVHEPRRPSRPGRGGVRLGEARGALGGQREPVRRNRALRGRAREPGQRGRARRGDAGRDDEAHACADGHRGRADLGRPPRARGPRRAGADGEEAPHVARQPASARGGGGTAAHVGDGVLPRRGAHLRARALPPFPGGSEAPTIELGRRPYFRGLQGKVKLDFGCGIADHRGLVKNAG